MSSSPSSLSSSLTPSFSSSPPSTPSTPSPSDDSSFLALPPPSSEQQSIIDAVKSGQCVSISSVAGSGKTTCMLQTAFSCLNDSDNDTNFGHSRHGINNDINDSYRQRQLQRRRPRSVTIITYNRSLSDECKERIIKCGLEKKGVWCYTIHGLVSRVAQKTCNDDEKLLKIVKEWDDCFVCTCSKKRTNTSPTANINNACCGCGYGCDDFTYENVYPIPLDLLMIDEAQDFRPSFYRALKHIIKMSQQEEDRRRRRLRYQQSQTQTQLQYENDMGVQICLVGDTKQMLYDFPTYGNDKACTKYMEEPEIYWGQFTKGRTWVKRKLTVSYRLTPNIAAFVNVIWGTSIEGGNTRVPNRKVEYICKYPYPPSSSSSYGNENHHHYLPTSFLRNIIDEHGEENVMLLSQSVRNEACPIRVHVNELMKETDHNGIQKYNFHIKESLRGFEGSDDVKNKVKVWTFCGSKGCEADCVVVFGFNVMNEKRIQSLNQVGVALSRARKRLIVIHEKFFKKKKIVSYPYYPMLGDSNEGLCCRGGGGGGKGGELQMEENRDSPCLHSVYCNGVGYHYNIPMYNKSEKSISLRSSLTQQAMVNFASNGVIFLKNNPLPETTESKDAAKTQEIVYNASEFSYFSANAEAYFLSFGRWTKEFGVINRISYTIDVHFDRTKEDVSALYGEALIYMLQWKMHGYCPNIETVVNDGFLRLWKSRYYKEKRVRTLLTRSNCEPMSPDDEKLFQEEFAKKAAGVLGKDLIRFLNTRVSLKKKRSNGEQIIYFPFRVTEAQEDDKHMKPFLTQIKTIYQAPNKSPANWIYLANAVMAFNQYHDKWNQIGTDPQSYIKWVESSALLSGLSRLSKIMKLDPEKDQSENACASSTQGDFECELVYEFSPEQHIDGNGLKVVGVQGICDWAGKGLLSSKGKRINVLEIKFVNELGNVNRLQVLVYCALLSLQLDHSCCGMLYNARTGELEVCDIELEKAKGFLYHISCFKKDGIMSWQGSQKIPNDRTSEVSNLTQMVQTAECDTTSSSVSSLSTKRKREHHHSMKKTKSPTLMQCQKNPIELDLIRSTETATLKTNDIIDLSLDPYTDIVDLTQDPSTDGST